jgi:hypothetical protein
VARSAGAEPAIAMTCGVTLPKSRRRWVTISRATATRRCR